MKVKALRSFVATMDGQKYRVQVDDVLELPPGADWLKAGLVEAVETPKKPAKSKATKSE